MSDLSVATFPHALGENPYQRLLLEALERRGVRPADPAIAFKPGLSRRASGGRIDAVHLHWLEFMYLAPGTGPASAALTHKRAAMLMLTLAELRRSGIRLVWTVHNLRPHEIRFPRLADTTVRSAIRAADAVVVHSRHAARRLVERFDPVAAPVVLPHPNYEGAYPPVRRGRLAMRRELGLPPDAFVYLMFGQIRPYKRVTEALTVFARITDPDVRIVLAGRVADPALEATVRDLAARDPRICLRLGSVAAEDVADLHAAADATFLHYRDVVSSGALMLALTFGVPVIAAANSTADEVVAKPGIEAYAGDGDALGALERMRTGDRSARRAAALAAAAAHPWDAMAEGLEPLLSPTPWPRHAPTRARPGVRRRGSRPR